MTRENSPFEREVNGFYDPIFKEKPAISKTPNFNENEWQKQSNQKLAEYGVPKRVVDVEKNQEVYNSTWHNFLIGFFIIFLIIGIGVFLWLIYDDHFKSEVTYSNMNTCPNISIPACPICPACNPSLICGNLSCIYQINNETNSS